MRSPTSSTSSSPPAWRTELDEIEEGKQNWVAAMRRFYTPFARDLEHAEERMRDVKRERRSRPTSPAPKCGAHDGGQVGPRRRVPRLLRTTRSARTPRTSRATPRARSRVAEDEVIDEKCEQVRQADADALRPLRQVSRLHRLPGVQDRALARPAGADRREVPRLRRGRDHGEALARRQDLLQLRPLSGVQVRHLGPAGARAVSAVRARRSWSRRPPSAPAPCAAA